MTIRYICESPIHEYTRVESTSRTCILCQALTLIVRQRATIAVLTLRLEVANALPIAPVLNSTERGM